MEKNIIAPTDTGLPWTQKQIGLITRTVARGATNDELGLFLYTAKRTGLDPLTRQLHFVKRKMWSKEKNCYEEVGTIQTGIDGYRTIAARTGELAGIEDAMYDSEDTDHPNKATITVYRLVAGNRVPFTASARWSEYAAVHPKSGEIMGLWKKMPYLMLAKCAEALALRKAFAFNLSDVYTEEELSGSAVIHEKQEMKQVVAEVKEAVVSEKKEVAEALMNDNHKPLSDTEATGEDIALVDMFGEGGAEEVAEEIGGQVVEESRAAKLMKKGMQYANSKKT